MNDAASQSWAFNFGLERESGEPIPRAVASELLEAIQSWAEARQLQIGGGYRKPHEGELDTGSIFDEENE